MREEDLMMARAIVNKQKEQRRQFQPQDAVNEESPDSPSPLRRPELKNVIDKTNTFR